MTVRSRYNDGMKFFSAQMQGAIWCVLLFFTVFLAIHALRLTLLVRSLTKKQPKPEKSDPVYFIVERKKKRPKKEFSEPKEISFR